MANLSKSYEGIYILVPSALGVKCFYCKKKLPFASITTFDGDAQVIENVCERCLDEYYPEDVKSILK